MLFDLGNRLDEFLSKNRAGLVSRETGGRFAATRYRSARGQHPNDGQGRRRGILCRLPSKAIELVTLVPLQEFEDRRVICVDLPGVNQIAFHLCAPGGGDSPMLFLWCSRRHAA